MLPRIQTPRKLLLSKITVHAKSRERLQKEQEQLETQLMESCWRVRGQFFDDFKEAFPGLSRKALFRDRCLLEAKKEQTALPDRKVVKQMYDLSLW